MIGKSLELEQILPKSAQTQRRHSQHIVVIDPCNTGDGTLATRISASVPSASSLSAPVDNAPICLLCLNTTHLTLQWNLVPAPLYMLFTNQLSDSLWLSCLVPQISPTHFCKWSKDCQSGNILRPRRLGRSKILQQLLDHFPIMGLQR